MTSDTPRTDEQAFSTAEDEFGIDRFYEEFGEYVSADFSRQLERELAAANAAIEQIYQVCTDNLIASNANMAMTVKFIHAIAINYKGIK